MANSDADLRTSALLDTPSLHLLHDYNPFALEDGGRSAPMAVELVYCFIVVLLDNFSGNSSLPWHGFIGLSLIAF
jgi:hypothetical protein